MAPLPLAGATRRVFVDIGGRTCPTKDSARVLEALQAAIARRGLHDVEVIGRGCFGLCQLAPNLYVEPDGVWYSRFTVEDVEEIVEEHLTHGRVVQRLVHYRQKGSDPFGSDPIKGGSDDASGGKP